MCWDPRFAIRKKTIPGPDPGGQRSTGSGSATLFLVFLRIRLMNLGWGAEEGRNHGEDQKAAVPHAPQVCHRNTFFLKFRGRTVT